MSTMSNTRVHESSAETTRRGSSIEPEQIIRHLFGAVYSDGKLHVVEAVANSDFEGFCTGTADSIAGVGGVKTHAARLRSTFTGLTLEVEECRRTRDRFVVSLRALGRFERSFGEIDPPCLIGQAGDEPHGPGVSFPGRATGTVVDGKLDEMYLDWNFESLRSQC